MWAKTEGGEKKLILSGGKVNQMEGTTSKMLLNWDSAWHNQEL